MFSTNKIFTPVAFSPMNKNPITNQLAGMVIKPKLESSKQLFFQSPKAKNEDENNNVNYNPGMLKISPNSGFTQFKKLHSSDEQKSDKGSS